MNKQTYCNVKKKCEDLINDNNHLLHINNNVQMECMKNQYLELVKTNNVNNNRYTQLLKEIENMYTLLENNVLTGQGSITTNSCNTAIFKHIGQPEIFTVKSDISIIYITAVAAGGAGGVGIIKNMYYYSGGGGGAGSAIIKKPIQVILGTVLRIYVGKGGSGEINGENTIIEILYPNGKTTKLTLHGGTNGVITKGGIGGINECGITFLNGSNGDDGNVTIPSCIAVCGGNGGNSMIYSGGKGGGNYFNNGGKGGSNSENIIGENGDFGSGGGGSVPRFVLDSGTQLSGNGGDGMVIIEW